MAPKRVAVFIDYQNVYRSARRTFGLDHGPHWEGQVHPQRLGLVLKGVGDDSRELVAVRVYRGMPSSRHDSRGYGAASRQIAAWRSQASTTVIVRPLRYPRSYPSDPPQEKGIDVCIALDYVMMALHDEYDVGVLFSADTDLIPALEVVARERGPSSCEVAAWKAADGPARRLRIKSANIWCHLLTLSRYKHVHDPTDYNVASPRR